MRGIVNTIGKQYARGVRLHLGGVKAHVGLEGNQVADEVAREGFLAGNLVAVTKGG